jgi:hypothetical protein
MMDEDLLIDILSALKSGDEYPSDIQRAWDKNLVFIDHLKFKEHWEWLKSRKHIIQKPNQNDLARVIINTQNDILTELLIKQGARRLSSEQDERIEKSKKWKEEHWILAKIIDSSINTIVALIIGAIAGGIGGYLIGKKSQKKQTDQEGIPKIDTLSKPLSSIQNNTFHLFQF